MQAERERDRSEWICMHSVSGDRSCVPASLTHSRGAAHESVSMDKSGLEKRRCMESRPTHLIAHPPVERRRDVHRKSEAVESSERMVGKACKHAHQRHIIVITMIRHQLSGYSSSHPACTLAASAPVFACLAPSLSHSLVSR